MRNAAKRRGAEEQLELFVSRPHRTSWDDLPADICQEVIRLLAQMLAVHRMSEEEVDRDGSEDR